MMSRGIEWIRRAPPIGVLPAKHPLNIGGQAVARHSDDWASDDTALLAIGVPAPVQNAHLAHDPAISVAAENPRHHPRLIK
jgi:hypothetical protein